MRTTASVPRKLLKGKMIVGDFLRGAFVSAGIAGILFGMFYHTVYMPKEEPILVKEMQAYKLQYYNASLEKYHDKILFDIRDKAKVGENSLDINLLYYKVDGVENINIKQLGFDLQDKFRKEGFDADFSLSTNILSLKF